MTQPEATPNDYTSLRVRFAVYAALALLTVAVYGRIVAHGFVGFDDDRYITENEYVVQGLTAESLHWAFTGIHHATWHPLTSVSHLVDVELFGLAPGAHHAVNLLLHVANALLMLFVFHRMTGSFWRSALVAALFAVHPFHVESVAWASSRKDVLSTLLFLLTLASYVSFTTRRRPFHYGLALIFFALGLMSKPMLVTVPCLLILLDYWPLGRLRLNEWKTTGIWLLVEKIPFFLLSAGLSVVTMVTQSASGAVRSFEDYGFLIRLQNAVVAYKDYLVKTVWPTDLAPFYPHAESAMPVGEIVYSVLLLAGVTAACAWYYRRAPQLVVGWLWFLGTLVPVIGLIQIGGQAMADRYTYIPLTGLFLMAAWSIPDLRAVRPPTRSALLGATAAAVAVLSIAAFRQAGYWKDSVTLFRRTVAVTEDNYAMQFNLVNALFREGRAEEAAAFFEERLRSDPENVTTLLNLANVRILQGKHAEAAAPLETALGLQPDNPDIHYHLGLVRAGQGDGAGALAAYHAAIERDPEHYSALVNLGNLYARQGDFASAEQFLRQAVRIRPDAANARFNLGSALSAMGRPADALAQFEEAIALDPDNFLSYYAVGGIFAAQGQREEAIGAFHEALRIRPDFAPAREALNALRGDSTESP